jgi:hypothetical protein
MAPALGPATTYSFFRYNSNVRSVRLRAVDVPTRSGASRTEQLRAVQQPSRAATSGSLKRFLISGSAQLLPFNYFLLLPEAEGRGEREAPKRTFLSVLLYDAFLRNLRQEPVRAEPIAFR